MICVFIILNSGVVFLANGQVLEFGRRRLNTLQAIDLDNKMAGHNESERAENKLHAAVMILPSGQTLVEWKAKAREHQEKMKRA